MEDIHFANDFEVQISTLWALSEYTEEMGATRIVPRSHLLGPNVKFDLADTVPAVMKPGSVLIYSGKLYHGAGRNSSNKVRKALNVNYALGWLRQEENQYLSCPVETAKTLPENLLRLMGYRDFQGHGRVGNWEDPIGYLTGESRRITQSDLGVDQIYRDKPPAHFEG